MSAVPVSGVLASSGIKGSWTAAASGRGCQLEPDRRRRWRCTLRLTPPSRGTSKPGRPRRGSHHQSWRAQFSGSAMSASKSMLGSG